jgi:sulfite reductase (ferredoxin)
VKPLFPASELPQEPAQARLLGLYPQRQPGLWMQRVKVAGGMLTAQQWRAVSHIARSLTPATPLHLTTRQDLELHDLTAEAVPAAQAAMAAAGLTGLGACGDTLRNITMCPCCRGGVGAFDLAPAATAVRATLEACESIYALPRKFKPSFSCSTACGQPFINDLAFVLSVRDGQAGFAAYGAGSLGARPATGIPLRQWLPAAHAPALALAMVRLFNTHGDRHNRSRARVRHIRQRMGDEAFLTALNQELEQVLGERPWPALGLPSVAQPPACLVLTFHNGDIRPEQADVLASLTEGGLKVVIGIYHQVMLFGQPEQLDAAATHPTLQPAAQPQAAIVACAGMRWCSRAVADTHGLAGAIRHAVGERLPVNVVVAISGCPNGCAHSAVADFGLIGMLGQRGGRRRQVYNLLAGGGLGHDDRLAEQVAEKLTAQEVVHDIAARLG